MLGPDTVRNVAAIDEYTSRLAVRPGNWLINEVEKALLRLGARSPLQQDRDRLPNIRLTCPIDLIEELNEALACNFRQRLANGLADDVTLPDQAQVGSVGEPRTCVPARVGRP